MRTSNSAIQTFKACRRMYELKYVHNLEPVHTSDALKRGSQYHELVEGLLTGHSAFKDCDDVKAKAMATAFQMYLMPYLDADVVEEWFSYETKSGHLIVGRIDGITALDEVIEHKTTSGLVNGEYFSRLEMDEQIPTYMLACNTNFIWYTVCSVPTIRQKKTESDSDFYLRCVEWFSDDTDSKISVQRLYRDSDSLEKFAEEQDAVVNEMENCKLFYRNPSNCMKWGRMCEYAPICMNYNPDEEYIQFKRREDLYEQIGKAEIREAGSRKTDTVTSTDETDYRELL